MARYDRRVLRIALEVLYLTSINILTFVGLGWVLRSVAGVSIAGTVALLVVPGALTLMAAFRGYYMWYERHYVRGERAIPTGVLRYAATLLAFAFLILFLALALLFVLPRRGSAIVAVLCVLMIYAAFALMDYMQRSAQNASTGSTGEGLPAEGFTAAMIFNKSIVRVFRLVLYTFLLASPLMFTLIFTIKREIASAIVFAISALIAAFCVVPRLRAEFRQDRRGL